MRRFVASLIVGILLAGGLAAGVQAQAVSHPDNPRGRSGSTPPPVYVAPKPAPPSSKPPTRGLKPLEAIPGLTGAGWVKRGSDADGDFDVLTLTGSKQPGPSGTVSILVQFRGYQDDRTPDGQIYRSGIVRFFFLCSERQYAPGNADYYDAGGRLVGSDPGSFQKAQILSVRRGTVADFVYEAACGRDEGPGRQYADGDDNDFPKGDLATGSGWLSARGYIVTASHVIEGGSRIWIYQEGKKLGEAQVVKDDPVNDVAVLKPLFDTSAYAGMRVESDPPGLGQRVFTLGYPLVDQLGGGSVKLTSGDISSLTGVDTATSRVDDPRYIQISIPVQSGNSGGPVIDDAGGVVGIVLSKSEMTPDREIMQNVNFALKASYIAEALAALPQLGKPKPVAARANLQATVAEVQSGVFLIVVEENGRPASPRTANRPRR
jgi:S1-C subfamily serine protease